MSEVQKAMAEANMGLAKQLGERVTELEAQLAEANYRAQVHSDIAAENNLLRCQAEAERDDANRLVEWLQGECNKAVDACEETNGENARLRAALEACEVVMDTAAMHDLPQQLPPAYRDSWAAAHSNARKVLRPDEQPAAKE